jgi:hypothetical protein
MEMTSEMRKYKADSISVFKSQRRGWRLRRNGVIKKVYFKFSKRLWSKDSKRVGATSIGTKFSRKTILKRRSCVTERSVR